MHQGRKVLLVEDEGTLRRVLARYLESRGFLVDQARSLAEARTLLGENRYDALVLDVGLPDGDGLSLLDLADRDRALVISATPDLPRYARCGVHHHLAKPLDLPETARTVEAFLPA